MSKKQLLSEGEIRRFMKYANLGPLTENFLSEMGGTYEEGYGHMEEEEEPMEPMEPMGDEEQEEPMDMGDEAPAGGEDAEAVVKNALDALAAELKAKLGVDITVDAGAAAAPEEPEMDVDMGGEEEPMGDEEEDEEEEEEALQPMDEGRIVSEVARRVMARLSESRKPAPARRSRAEAVNEVTDRIMKRILKSK